MTVLHPNQCLFVCFDALRPKSTAMVMAGRQTSVTTRSVIKGLHCTST